MRVLLLFAAAFVVSGCSDAETRRVGPVETEAEALSIARGFADAVPPSGPALAPH